jgi:hypothetical protein
MPNVHDHATTLHDFDEAWAEPRPGHQSRAVRRAAERLRERFAAGPRVVSVRTLELATLPYPSRFAFQGAALSPAPFVVMTHRALLVQFLRGGELKNLLFNPTDVVAARETPYFARLRATMPELAERVVARIGDPIDAQLRRLGLAPSDIDYIAYDHFHTQDLRPILGTTDGQHAARFPNAKLFAPAAEWESWEDTHPMQRAWFVPEGRARVNVERVILTRADLQLGEGVLLLRTPGHSLGNQTLFVATDSGVWGSSENGTCVDNYSPHESTIPGLSLAARTLDVDVVLNANTPEHGGRQYVSMLLEKTLVDRVKHAPGFVQMFASSEVTPHAIAPGLKPTILHGAVSSGRVVTPNTRATAAATA